ncbi:MAG: hypothetical protein A07HR60_01495 [uncultured archaeon A07HR60]|jgi:hypothetical protein|nr:MAG: hypothetical protein A07HR60_01495 [uncultured archaeon A07HR60]
MRAHDWQELNCRSMLSVAGYPADIAVDGSLVKPDSFYHFSAESRS